MDLIVKCDVLGFFLHSIINIDLIMPYYFASFEEMIIHYLINNIWNQKKFCLFHIYLFELHVHNYFEPFTFNGQQHVFIIGCNGTMKKAWILNFWFSTTSIIMNIAHWKDDDIHYMTISNLKKIEVQQGLLWTTYLQKERLNI